MGFAARYDLRRRTASFDFFTWMCHVKFLGATEIVFGMKMPKNYGWSQEEVMRRFESIVLPGPALAGMSGAEAFPGEGVETGSHRINQLAALAIGKVGWRLRSVLPPANERFTVTLRQSAQKPERNSEEAVWREFARQIGARVIEDYSVVPLPLYERFALYAGAEMNFGVVNGPLAVLFYTHYPVMMCDCATDAYHMAGHGIEAEKQHPLALPGQSLVWERPTVDGLMARFKEAGF